MTKETRTIRIVCVDDHEIVRVGLKLLLDSWEDMSLIAEGKSGREAIDLVRELKPDIVLMDIGMPDIDGIEAVRQIREIDDSVRILMLTSYTSVKAIQDSLNAGANGYCLKDVDGERLKRAIWSLIDGDFWIDARATKDVVSTAFASGTAAESAAESGDDAVSRTSDRSEATPIAGESPDRNSRIYAALSNREIEVLRLLVEGLSNKEIGEKLFISRDTVKTHIRHIMEKLAVTDRTEAAVKAIRHKIV